MPPVNSPSSFAVGPATQRLWRAPWASITIRRAADVVFFTVKDAAHSLHGIKAV